MKIAEIYSHKDGENYINQHHSAELKERGHADLDIPTHRLPNLKMSERVRCLLNEPTCWLR